MRWGVNHFLFLLTACCRRSASGRGIARCCVSNSHCRLQVVQIDCTTLCNVVILWMHANTIFECATCTWKHNQILKHYHPVDYVTNVCLCLFCVLFPFRKFVVLDLQNCRAIRARAELFFDTSYYGRVWFLFCRFVWRYCDLGIKTTLSRGWWSRWTCLSCAPTASHGFGCSELEEPKNERSK